MAVSLFYGVRQLGNGSNLTYGSSNKSGLAGNQNGGLDEYNLSSIHEF